MPVAPVQFDPSTSPSTVQPADRRWVIVSPQRTQRPWIGQTKAEPLRRPGSTRGATCVRATSVPVASAIRVRVDVRLRERLRRVAPRRAVTRRVGDVDSDELEWRRAVRITGRRRVPGAVLLAASRPHPGRHGPRRGGRGDRAVAVAAGRTRADGTGGCRSSRPGVRSPARRIPHPHGQIWASTFLPDEIVEEMGHAAIPR